MTSDKKIKLIRQLEAEGVLREECPVGDRIGNTAYWHFRVLDLNRLSVTLRDEYNRLGEIRW